MKTLVIVAAVALGIASAHASCEQLSETGVGAEWEIGHGSDSWTLPTDCDAALDEAARLAAAEPRRPVSIQTVLTGDAPTALALARLAAIAHAVEKGLVERGITRARIRLREFQFPARGSAGASKGGYLILRIGRS